MCSMSSVMVPPPAPEKFYDVTSAFASFKRAAQEPPESPICKCLFGASNPTETSKLLKSAIQAEESRFKHVWDFDPRRPASVGNATAEAGEAAEPSPTMANRRRFDWKLQDNENLPYFYYKSYPSLPRTPLKASPNQQEACARTPRRQKAHESPRSRPSPRPLACRNANESPAKKPALYDVSKRPAISKRLCVPLMFASPPRIAATRPNPALVRVVTAVRPPTDDAATTTSPVTSSPGKIDGSLSDSQQHRRPQASKQLFSTTTRQSTHNKRKQQQKTSGQQKLITDMMPMRRKLRSAFKQQDDNKTLSPLQSRVETSPISA